MNNCSETSLSAVELTHRLQIPPVAEVGTSRPLWSVMIPTYNCARYLRETLASVLAQAPASELMQIEVVDDCSTKDNPEAVVREVGRGRVTFYRQPKNVGHTRNFETCLLHSRGRLVHLLHGDDMVRPGFYAKMETIFAEHPEIGAAFTRTIIIDEHGNWTSLLPLELSESGVMSDLVERLVERQRIQTPAMVVKREVYETLGAFDRRLSWTEDWEMWTRIASRYPIWHEVESLALYRAHSTSNSGVYQKTGESIRDLNRAYSIMGAYVPGQRGRMLVRKGRQIYAASAVWRADDLARKGEIKAAFAQVRGAFRLSPTPLVAWWIFHMACKAVFATITGAFRK